MFIVRHGQCSAEHGRWKRKGTDMNAEEKNRTPSSSAAHILQTLTAQDFLNFGLGHIAYVRPILSDGDESGCWGVFAADGVIMTTHDNAEEAILALRESDLRPISVQ